LGKFKKIGTIIRTISYLKPIQVVYQIKNRLFKTKTLNKYEIPFSKTVCLPFFKIDEAFDSLLVNEEEYSFTFLNLQKSFFNKIDWNFEEYGKLWNYNLQYLDYLRQENISIKTKLNVIHSLYSNLSSGKLKLEPYPASLRIMNLIRFVCSSELIETEKMKLQKYIRAEANYLHHNLEYHLLANHLLENLFAMNMAASYFDEQKLINKYQKLIILHLNEQILEDGAHFERSPMYHKIIFFRVLELYYFTNLNNSLKQFLKVKLSKMLSWLTSISFKNDQSPQFNDSTENITYSNNFFKTICKELNIDNAKFTLSTSGYRKYNNDNLEVVIDVDGINPSFQPGHAHADTFSFCLNYNNKPIIVDPGISTYNIGKKRDLERSTKYHNTIEVNNENSAEVWAGFRVGRRLKTTIINENDKHIEVKHDGYKRFGISTIRTLNFEKYGIELIDVLKGKKVNLAQSYLHFHPEIMLTKVGNTIIINDEIEISFSSNNFTIQDYDYCLGYNQTTKAKKIVVKFQSNSLETLIKQL
jgi:uncharacterized heparinase superfamily protein